jgi:hypothetical protein
MHAFISAMPFRREARVYFYSTIKGAPCCFRQFCLYKEDNILRSYSKKVFLSGVAQRAKTDWPNLGVGRSVPVLKILEYPSGCDPQSRNKTAGSPATWGNLTAALTCRRSRMLFAGNQNPFFEIASKSGQNTLYCLRTSFLLLLY